MMPSFQVRYGNGSAGQPEAVEPLAGLALGLRHAYAGDRPPPTFQASFQDAELQGTRKSDTCPAYQAVPDCRGNVREARQWTD